MESRKKADNMMEEDLDLKNVLNFMDLYFNNGGTLYSHLHDSFNKFMDEDLKNFMENGEHVFSEHTTGDGKFIRYKFMFSNILIRPPVTNDDELMFPMDARDRNLTYASVITSDVTQIQEIYDINTDEKIMKIIGKPEINIPIASIPIMIKSKYCSLTLNKEGDSRECDYDPGGYFIINGMEKVVISQDRMCENKPLAFVKKESGTEIYTVQVNSKSYRLANIIQVIKLQMKKDNVITINVPLFSEIPVFILFKALGIDNERDIVRYVTYDETDIGLVNVIRQILESTLSDKGIKIQTQNEAINYLTTKLKVVKKFPEVTSDAKQKQKELYVKHLLEYNFLPHVEGGLFNKAVFLGYMINKLIRCFMKRIPIDDRDSYVNKRIDLPGTLMEEQFKQHFRAMLDKCNQFFKKKNQSDEDPTNIISHITPSIIEQGIKTALSTGFWGKKKGVAQMLEQLSYLLKISSLRRIEAKIGDTSNSKLQSPRYLHPSSLGFLCCLTGDTEILLGDGKSTKKIKDMKNGDIIMSVDIKTHKNISTKIKNYFEKKKQIIYEIKTMDGKTLKCTGDHPILAKLESKIPNVDKMILAEKLKIGDKILTYLFKEMNENMITYSKIESIYQLPPEDVYDFTTCAKTHTMIANGCITSNCVETPEHGKVGLIKHLSMVGGITVIGNSQYVLIKEWLFERIKNIKDIPANELMKYIKVFLNGEWIGMVKNAEIYKELKVKKSNGDFDNKISVVYDFTNMEIRVYCDSGRLFRPVLNVINNELQLTKKHIDLISLNRANKKDKITNWNEFMLKYPKVISYIDMEEMPYVMLAIDINEVKRMKQIMISSIEKAKDVKDETIINRYDDMVYVNYDCCDTHPQLLVGAITTNVPFCNYEEGTRNIYQYSQGKQGMGIYASNYRYRYRTDWSYILYYPERPLINTYTSKYIFTDIMSPGENAIIAISTYTGYNQEDSIIVNGASLDRGLFRSKSLKTYISVIEKNQSTSQDDKFMKPDFAKVTGMKIGSYDKLNNKGYVPEEVSVVNGDVLIGKVKPIQPTEHSSKIYKDSSEIFKSIIPGVVDKVLKDIYNNEGYEMIKVRIRSERIPTIGDKFCTRYGQKFTIGIVLKQSDMLVSEKGLVPDLIMTPNAIPSRKTASQLIECVYGKMAALQGHEMDGTAFSGIDVNHIQNELEKLGYKRDGTEVFYNGMTGTKIDAEIYTGPAFVQRLKHMVYDKIHCLTLDHEVLTISGWKFYKDLTMQDEIATMENGILKYMRPTKLLYYPEYDGEFYKVENEYVSLMTTMNHRMWISGIYKDDFHFQTSDNLVGVCCKYQKSVNIDVEDYNVLNKNNNNWLLFIGLLLNEDTTGEDINCLSITETKYKNSVIELLTKLNVQYKMISNSLIHIIDFEIRKLWNEINKSKINKKLPNWIWKLSHLQCRMLIDGIMFLNFEKNVYYTYSKQFANDFMQLCIHAGWACNLDNYNDVYKLTIIKGEKRRPTVNFTTINDSIIQTKCDVFCMEIPTGIFMVRRNGKHVWTGNSRAIGSRTLLTRQPPEGRARNGGLRLGEMERDCLIALGVAGFLKEKFMDSSDIYATYICEICGLFAQRMRKTTNKPYASVGDVYYCPACKNKTKIAKIIIPYAFKLLLQEMMSMCIAPRIKVKDII
jgi:DNA-directed RNA polymerase beta subunit